MFKIKNILAHALMALSLATGAAAASPVYHVAVDTSALAGKSGYLDFLIVGQGDTATTTARLSHFSGDFSGDIYTDNASGSLSGATIGSAAALNEVALWSNFGGLFSFDVSFEQALDDIAGALLQIALLDDNFMYLAPTTGDVAGFELSPGQPIRFAGSAYATITEAAADVPEPSAAALVLIGLMMAGAVARRRS
jgi:hypothetical protein